MPDNIVRLICPNLRCRKVLSVPETARGKKVRCRECGMRVQIPVKESVPAAPARQEPTDE